MPKLILILAAPAAINLLVTVSPLGAKPRAMLLPWITLVISVVTLILSFDRP